MAEISRIKLPSGNVYDLKDATARQLIAQGVSFIMAWDGNSTPVVANIPSGVVVTYNDQNYTGTLAASSSTSGKFYLVKSATQVGDDTIDVFDEYVVVNTGTSQSPTYAWEKIGDTRINLSNLGALAYKDNVTLNKGTGDDVLGKDTTFSVSVPVYSAEKTNIKATASGAAVGADGTDAFVKSYPGTTSKLATTSIKGVAGTDTATLVSNKTSKKLQTTSIKGVAGTESVSAVSHTSKKMQTTTIPNVTNVGTASSFQFAMGTDQSATGGSDESETLIITGSNSTVPTLGTAITAATGSLVATTATDNVGDTLVDTVTETAKTVATANADATTVATGSLVANTETSNVGDSLIESFDVTSKTLATANSDDTTVATGSLADNGGGDSVMTGLGTATTATALTGVKVTTQPTIALSTGATAGEGVISVATDVETSANTNNVTVGTNDEVKVAKYDDLSVSVS